jgi:hypothetical protein
MATLGQIIGKIEHAFSTRNDNNETVQLVMTFDFTNASDAEIIRWATSSRAIAIQRPLRTLTAREIKALNKTTISASDCGKKITSPKQKLAIGIAALRAAGEHVAADELQIKHDAM